MVRPLLFQSNGGISSIRNGDNSSGSIIQLGKIRSCWLLEKPQSKLGHNCKEMIEDTRLYCFIIIPVDVIAETVDLYWQAFRTGLQLPDNQGHVVMNLGVLPEVIANIHSKCAYIRQMPLIDIGLMGFSTLALYDCNSTCFEWI